MLNEKDLNICHTIPFTLDNNIIKNNFYWIFIDNTRKTYINKKFDTAIIKIK